MVTANSMKHIDILIVVDALGALASRDLQNNVYLVDTNKFCGSYKEGQAELETACHDGQLINWRVVSICPSNDVDIVEFTGEIINKKICVPQKQGIAQDIYWVGEVETRGDTGKYQYSVVLTIDGARLTFDPYLVAKK